MGTYWDEFLKQYPFVRHCALETTLELFYFYCDSENQDLFKDKIQKVREQFYAPPVSKSDGIEREALFALLKWMQDEPIFNIDSIDEILDDYDYYKANCC